MARRSWSVNLDDGSCHHMVACFLCDGNFQFGPDRYDGEQISAWGVVLCNSCYQSIADGVAPESGYRLIDHLAERRLPARRDGRGWLNVPI